MENSELQKRIDDLEEYGIITLEFDEYFGSLVISKPLTIEGQGCTICSKKGPVVSTLSDGVVLKNLRIETSSSDDTALKVQPGSRVKMEKVIVKGKVSGLIHEDGVWEYPDVLNIYPVFPREKNYFCFDVNVPISCVMETEIANLRIVNPGIQPGHNRVCLEIEGLKEDVVLFGQIEIKSPYLIRLIAISGGSFGVSQDMPKPDASHPIILNKIEKPSESVPKKVTESQISIASKPLMKWGIIGAGVLISLIIAIVLLFGSSSDQSDKVQPAIAVKTPKQSEPPEKPAVPADKPKEADKPKAAVETPKPSKPVEKPPAPAEKTEADKQKEQTAQQIKELTEAGNKALQSDNLEEAEKNFQKIIGLDKENKNAKSSLIQIGKRYAELGKRFVDAGDCQKSQSYFQSAKRLAPDDPDIVKAEAAAKEAKGTLNIHCDPQADIVIDDNDIKKTAPTNGIRLECGKHNIKLVRKNDSKYPVRTAEVTIRTNRAVTVIAIGNSVNVVNE